MYRIDGQGPWPDPFSRFQPQGPHGPSQLLAPDRYRWHDREWSGIELRGQVIYELHIGTFTPEGTFDAASARLQWLKDMGITLIEVMPVAEFPGRWNWGYDGVQLFAPFHGYGDHEALKRFVDAAHAIGLGVILDVVYNHLGPDGNYLGCYSPYYFTSKRNQNRVFFTQQGFDLLGEFTLTLGIVFGAQGHAIKPGFYYGAIGGEVTVGF